MNEIILKGSKLTEQLVEDDSTTHLGYIDPFINFKVLLDFYYYNVYHQRSIKLKASLLSQVQDSNLDKFLPPNEYLKEFLLAFTTDLEIYGNSFLEKAGTSNNFYLYNILGYQGRVNKHKEIYQINSLNQHTKLEGYQLKYYSPKSKYYGEPDYLTQLISIKTTKQADLYNSSFFDNGAKPGMIVSFENSTPSDEQKAAAKQFFGSNFKGYDNAHKSMLFWTGKTKEGESPAKINFERLDQIEDMSWESLKKVNRDEIIAAHGVPPRLVGVMAAGQLGGGTELIDQLHSFIQTTLNPKIDLLEDFFARIGVKHKVKTLDVTNFKDDTNLVTALVDRKIISIQDAQEILGLKSK
ncbi:MAG: phage portal protein [Arcobacteraceae bacterium]